MLPTPPNWDWTGGFHRIPTANSILEEHFQNFAGELLCTIYFADLACFVVAAYERNAENEIDEADRILELLDELYGTGDDYLVTSVFTGFLEGLPWPDGLPEALFERMPARLRSAPRGLMETRPKSEWGRLPTEADDP